MVRKFGSVYNRYRLDAGDNVAAANDRAMPQLAMADLVYLWRRLRGIAEIAGRWEPLYLSALFCLLNDQALYRRCCVYLSLSLWPGTGTILIARRAAIARLWFALSGGTGIPFSQVSRDSNAGNGGRNRRAMACGARARQCCTSTVTNECVFFATRFFGRRQNATPGMTSANHRCRVGAAGSSEGALYFEWRNRWKCWHAVLIRQPLVPVRWATACRR